MNTKDLCDRLEDCARTGLAPKSLLLEARDAILQLDRQRSSMLRWLDEAEEQYLRAKSENGCDLASALLALHGEMPL
jgi:hypothetical protein